MLYKGPIEVDVPALTHQIKTLSKLLEHLDDAEYERTVGGIMLLETIRDELAPAARPKRVPAKRKPTWIIAELWSSDDDSEHLVAKAIGLSNQKEQLRAVLETSWDPQASDAGMRRAYRYEDIEPPCREITYNADDNSRGVVYIDVETLRRRGWQRAFEKATGRDQSCIIRYDEEKYYDEDGTDLLET
jgi:hypothetical protein